MNGDTSVRKAYIPRGMAIFTGEDTPACGGESTIARYLCIELKRKEIDLKKLKECQENSLSLNIAMSAYIEWVGKNMDTLPYELKTLFEQFREEAINKLDSHNRFHEIVAWMKIGLLYGLKFAEELKVITEEEGNQLLESHIKRLFEIMAMQELETGDEKISVKFINAMAELMNSGQVETKPVPDCKSWEDENDDTEKSTYYKAKNIDWHDHEFYYLFPQLSYSAISQFYHKQGLSFGVSPTTLWKELNVEGIIITTEKNRNTILKKINGKGTRVLKIPKVIIEEQEIA